MNALSVMNAYSTFNKVFTDPNDMEMNPVSRMIYGAGVTAMYSQKLNDMFYNQLSTFMNSFENNMSNVLETVDPLTSNTSQPMWESRNTENRSVGITNAQIVDVTVENGADIKKYQFEVEELASAQENKSDWLNSEASSMLNGSYNFNIKEDDHIYEIDVEISDEDNNEQALNKIADAINNVDSNFIAEVNKDEINGVVLKITSSKIGEDSSFELSEAKLGIIEQLGLNKQENISKASNAVYRIDNKQIESNINKICIDDGKVNIELKNVGITDIKIKQDEEIIVEDVKEFVSSYNNMMEFIKSKEDNTEIIKLSNSFKMLAQVRKTSLEQVGIEVMYDGQLQFNEKKLRETVDEKEHLVEIVLSGKNGFADRVKDIAEEALETPKSIYLDEFKNNNTIVKTYDEYYQYMRLGNQFLQFTMQGLMFDNIL